jgi:riboflavin synthase
MFTGLIEEVGEVLALEGARLTVAAKIVLDESALGASIAVNGACLTVVERGADRVAFDLGPETIARTALGELGPGERVNLERPMRLGGLLGGHLVQGHVDGVGLVTSLVGDGENARLRVAWQDAALARLLIPQGSVAVDGVSLTVAALDGTGFEIMLIPHTLAQTTLGTMRPGRHVNLEMDMIGKYVQRFMTLGGSTA